MKPSPGTVKMPSITAPMKLMSSARARFEHRLARILAVDMHDALHMRLDQASGSPPEKTEWPVS